MKRSYVIRFPDKAQLAPLRIDAWGDSPADAQRMALYLADGEFTIEEEITTSEYVIIPPTKRRWRR